MTARFIALPVGQGDSFYLEQSDFSVLVDGGRSQNAIADLFCTQTGSKGVDVLVCTHNDADHANGVLGFLRSGLRCGEVWLPGRWLHGLSALLGDPGQLIDDVAEGLPSQLELPGEDRIGHRLLGAWGEHLCMRERTAFTAEDLQSCSPFTVDAGAIVTAPIMDRKPTGQPTRSL